MILAAFRTRYFLPVMSFAVVTVRKISETLSLTSFDLAFVFLPTASVARTVLDADSDISCK